MKKDVKALFDWAVIGGGIVGAATAYKLSLKHPNSRIALFEKEQALSLHQTGRNSGVIHSGIYYKPGSLKAENCRNGREQLLAFAEKHHIPYQNLGKLILATKKEELPVLDRIYANGQANKTPGICFLSAEEIKQKEPFAEGVKAIWVPSAGIIDYPAATNKMADLAVSGHPGSELLLQSPIHEMVHERDGVLLRSGKDWFRAGAVFVCAGLQADRFAAMDGLKIDMRIVGFRGDYYQLREEAADKIRHLIYPVPDPRYPFLGVHYTPMIGGEVECGPNAVFTFKREGYRKTSFSFKDTFQALGYKGTWNLFRKNWAKGLDEYRRAFSKALFVRELQGMVPSIGADDVFPTRSGVRAQAVGPNGEMIDDFVVLRNKRVTHVINAPSPAATACLAIADEIIREA